MADLPFTPYTKIDLDPVKSQRLFVVANGPSLQITPMELLDGEEVWCMNLIHWLNNFATSWKPTRWWWGDHPQHLWQLQEIFNFLKLFPEIPSWIRTDVAEMVIGHYKPFGELDFYDELPPQIVPWERCKEHAVAGFKSDRTPENPPHFPDDGSLCKPGTTIMPVLCQAYKEGYREIYLVGADAGFTSTDVSSSHFHPDYYRDTKVSEASANWTNMLLHWQADVMDRFFKENGGQIFNAGIGGSLYEHKRVNLVTLFT